MNHWTPENTFVYRKEGGASRRTVRRLYDKWRAEKGLPERCDNPECQLHVDLPSWNSENLSLILDHINGNNTDNRLKNLRLLCPNCDSLLPTKGGRNKGRVEKSEGGFAIVVKESGKRNFVLPAEPGRISLSGQPVALIHRDADGKIIDKT
jgi:hypothetical protein